MITLCSITQRYSHIVFPSCTHWFFPQHFQYFVREFLSDASSNKVMRNKGTSDAEALFTCLRVMQKKLYHQKYSGECVVYEIRTQLHIYKSILKEKFDINLIKFYFFICNKEKKSVRERERREIIYINKTACTTLCISFCKLMFQSKLYISRQWFIMSKQIIFRNFFQILNLLRIFKNRFHLNKFDTDNRYKQAY